MVEKEEEEQEEQEREEEGRVLLCGRSSVMKVVNPKTV